MPEPLAEARGKGSILELGIGCWSLGSAYGLHVIQMKDYERSTYTQLWEVEGIAQDEHN